MAVKKIAKNFTDDVSFQREMNALLHLRKNGGHPNIYSLRENFNEGNYYILVFDLVSGGEMFDHLIRQGAYSEADAARLVREVASALAFLHGIGCVHADLKPENLMLSTEMASSSAIKLVDFGCAQVTAKDSVFQDAKKGGTVAKTVAYCPPEVLDQRRASSIFQPSMDMWALGVILYIMLTGTHPFDLEGNASDDEIKKTILTGQGPPLKDSPFTAHLSTDAIDVIRRLLNPNPRKRMTAIQMLDHPWVRGETARKDKMADSDKRLAMYRVFKSRLEAQVFEDIINWSEQTNDDAAKKMSLLERSFNTFDPQRKGYITTKDLKRLTERQPPDVNDGAAAVQLEMNEDTTPLSLSGFSELLSDHMKNKFYPKGHVVYRQGEKGNHMYFINSGTVEVSTKGGIKTKRSQGDFFGEGACLDPKQIRSSTIKCLTPVHLIEISKEYFDKYLKSGGENLNLNLREKSQTRKQNRARSILRLQQNLRELQLKKGDYLFKVGDKGRDVFILEEGKVDVIVEGQVVFIVKPGDMLGESAFLFSRPRNASAKCATKECKLHVMEARAFSRFLKSYPQAKGPIHDIAKRREFQKAIVFKTKKCFPSDPKDLRAAFDAADEDSSGVLSLEDVRSMLKRMDPTLTEEEVQSILKALDLDESGEVKFEEFKRIFQLDEAKASAI